MPAKMSYGEQVGQGCASLTVEKKHFCSCTALTEGYAERSLKHGQLEQKRGKWNVHMPTCCCIKGSPSIPEGANILAPIDLATRFCTIPILAPGPRLGIDWIVNDHMGKGIMAAHIKLMRIL